ncbi:MAG: glutathione S-transferase family protein [Thiothrix sp.]
MSVRLVSQPQQLELVSFSICPFAQRSVIALNMKGVNYTLTYLTPGDSPAWFRAISPLGKVPVLIVDGTPLFESAVILEYLDEVYPPSLHPTDPLQKAQHRAWIEYASELLGRLHTLLTATSADTFAAAHEHLQQGLQRLETELAADTPYFAGQTVRLVDCAYAPLLMRIAILKQVYGLTLQLDTRMQAWSTAVLGLDAVKASVVENFTEVFRNFLTMKNSYLLQ